MVKQIDKFNKEYITAEGLEITLTNSEIKDIMKVIKSYKIEEIYKEIPEKLKVKQEDFTFFLGH